MSKKTQFTTYSMMVGKKYNDDWWEWCVFVNNEPEVIKTIKQVEYTLHSSFPDPIRIVDDKESRFSLYSSGWGEFNLGVEVTFEDDTLENQTIWVKFLNNWPTKLAPSKFNTTEESLVYNALIDDKYRYRKLETVVKLSKLSEEKVLAILDKLAKEELVRKSPFKTLDKKEMWGVTAKIGKSPPPV